jgi:nicotinamidase-related amidase
LGGGGGAERVGRLVVDGQTTDVCHGFDARVGLEVGLDLVFVVDACVLDRQRGKGTCQSCSSITRYLT